MVRLGPNLGSDFMKTLFFLPACTTAALLGIISKSAIAASVSIVNPSFESFALADGTFTNNGVGLSGFGWSVSAGPFVGVFNPSSEFTSIPDGQNTAYSHGPLIAQILSSTLTANTRYSLQVSVGDANNIGFGGYSVQLVAGGSVLAEDNNTLLPPDGGFVTSSVAFTALSGDPRIGLALEIRLLTFSSDATETNFDNVRLDASPVPESRPALLLGLGLTALAVFRLRFRTMLG